MPYDVIVASDRDLLDRWVVDVGHQVAALSDPASIRHRALVGLGKLGLADRLDRVDTHVADVLRVAVDVPNAESGREKVRIGLVELKATGLTARPDDDDDAWLEAFSRIYEGVDEIRAASLATAGDYEKLEDAGRVLGQISSVDDGTTTLLVLREVHGDAAEAVAIASVRGWDEGSKEIIIADLVAAPAYIVAQRTGAGGALVEHIVRRAKRFGASVSLIPLGGKVQAVYTKWGFTGSGDGMSMKDQALDRFLETHTVFAGV